MSATKNTTASVEAAARIKRGDAENQADRAIGHEPAPARAQTLDRAAEAMTDWAISCGLMLIVASCHRARLGPLAAASASGSDQSRHAIRRQEMASMAYCQAFECKLTARTTKFSRAIAPRTLQRVKHLLALLARGRMLIERTVNNNSTTPVLDRVKFPADLRQLPESELRAVAEDLRRATIDAVSVTGGHLGSSLGVVELTVALALCL